MKKVTKALNCRVCKNKNLKKILSLGKTPLANSFLKYKDLGKKEDIFPLELNFCERCCLVQLSHIVNPNLMFNNYLYASSTSKIFVNHFEKYARDLYKRFKLTEKDLVVDIGSNDGILLKPFKKLGVRILGVDPAKNIAALVNKNGIKTIAEYFTPRVAGQIVKKYGKAKIITANNVFAHTNNWIEFSQAVKILLKDEGVFIIEAPYLLDLIQKNLFDTIYHEHLSYVSVKPLIYFFGNNNMVVFDIKRVSTHGGSIRIFVKKPSSKYKINKSVNKCLKEEKKAGLNLLKTYEKFSKNIEVNKKLLAKMLNKLKLNGKKIVGYGAPAKGNTLLNYFSIDRKTIDYIVDDSKLKQNLYTPGTHILITSPDRLKTDKFNYILILAWNFYDSIIKNQSYLKRKGVKFIIPVPAAEIVN